MIPYEELVAALQGSEPEQPSSSAWPTEPPRTLQNEPPTSKTALPAYGDREGTAVDIHNPVDRSSEIDLGDVLSDEEI